MVAPGRGRKPKPTHLRIIEGNPGKRAINKAEPKPVPIAPKCPVWLTAEARREWRRVAPELERLGLLTVVDRAALAGYCQSYARWREAEKVISEQGPTYTSYTPTGGKNIRHRPEVKIAQASLDAVRRFCIEFGLTPSSRSRMTVPGAPDEGECQRCAMPLSMCGCG